MFKRIETSWVENPYTHTRTRIVCPAWVGWLLVRFDGKPIHPVVGRVFGFIFEITGAHKEIIIP